MARYERPQQRFERHDRVDYRERYDRPAERFERPAEQRWPGPHWDREREREREREPVRMPSRGVHRTWEQSYCQGDHEYGVEGRELRPAKRHARSPTTSSYVVPHSLSAHTEIGAAVAAAKYLHKDDIEVACILFEYAYNITQRIDPLDQGRGVLEFKSALKSAFMQRRVKPHISRSKDVDILTEFHKIYKERKNIATLDSEEQAAREGRSPVDENPEYQAWRTEKLKRFYEISNILKKAANFLAEVDPIVGSSVSDPARKELNTEALNMEQFKACNMLPLKSGDVSDAVQHSPEVTSATRALNISEWSPFPRFEAEYSKSVGRDVLDIFDFLHYAFCFQKENVSNQREHLILLLANAESRVTTLSEVPALAHNAKFDVKLVEKVHDGILANYIRWCDFLKQQPQTKLANNPQQLLCLIALYLLIWGEAVNARVLPERLCHIFHHAAGECLTLLDKNDVERSKVSIKLIKGTQHEELYKNIRLVPDDETMEKVRYHLVLDVNGVLCDVDGPLQHMQVRWRPNLRSFLQFCHNNFVVIYWSACKLSKLEYLVGEMSKLSGVHIDKKQCISQTECLVSKYKDKDKPHKPIFLKPLSKVFEAFPGANVRNTLIIDDSPDKNALNHPENSIHPVSFKTFTSVVDRHTLLNLKGWLEGLLASNENVQEYVLRNRPADGSLSIHGDHHRHNALLSGAFR